VAKWVAEWAVGGGRRGVELIGSGWVYSASMAVVVDVLVALRPGTVKQCKLHE